MSQTVKPTLPTKTSRLRALLLKDPLTRRLLPLYVAAFTQVFCMWVATEKLFMTEIGFDASAMGLMAAMYAMFVPLVEIPSGVLADRWSRRGVLIVASAALILSTLVGGLSHNVPTYVLSAFILGIYFAMASGTFEAIVYDTVLEETGNSKDFERREGRVRLFSSLGGLIAALSGAAVAALTSPRVTYFVTIPVLAISVIALMKFREPQLHKMKIASSLKDHVATTYKALLQKNKLLPMIALLALGAMLSQLLLEFGSLWLVELGAPLALYGLSFGALVAAMGLGGFLAGRVNFYKTPVVVGVIIAMIACSLSMVYLQDAYVITAAQVAIMVMIVLMSILFTKLLHDSVQSHIRAGVASGVGAFSWILFVPASLTFGWVANKHGIFSSGWLMVALAVAACMILARVVGSKDFKASRGAA